MLIQTIKHIENLIDWSGRAVSWLTLFMVIITFVVVVLRYVFDIGWIALQESITYLHAMVFLIGAAYTLQQDAHVRVDIIYNKLSQKNRAWVNLLGSVFMLLPLTVFISYISWSYITGSWSVMESSREAGGLPGVFLLKSLILAMSVLLILQGLAQVMRSITNIREAE